MRHLASLSLAAALALGTAAAAPAKDLSLAYWMGPGHPMNAGVFQPFADRLAEVSGGEMTITMFPGGALNTVPPKQYQIMLDGIADIIFTLPGYTSDAFPKTNVISYPGVCDDPVSCTEALWRAMPIIEDEYNAKILAIWGNDKPVLITRDKPVRTIEDLQGMKVRVAAKSSVASVEALGASAVAQPASVLNQNLANGVIDAIMIGASAINSFKLHEPGNYVTDWFPASGSAMVLLLNKDVYNGLSDEQKGWVDAASEAAISMGGAEAYVRAAEHGFEVAEANGMEIVAIPEEERARFNAAIAASLEASKQEEVGDMTVGEVMAVMKGE